MPIADTNATFLHGLSDLWLRFFKDKNQLEAMYRGTENLIGQAYLDLLDTVLNISLRNTPVFNKEYHKLLTIREDQCTYDTETDRWTFDLTGGPKSFTFLCNKILDPDSILQVDVDFEINLLGTHDELRFKVNPFTAGTAGGPSDGFAYRTVQVADPGGGPAPIDVIEMAFWVPDASFDRGNLFLVYGNLLNYFSPSSESYKALLQGIMQYFILGPTLTHVVSTLNVCSGLPVIRNDGEVLQSVDTSDPTVNTVITDEDSYIFPKSVPLRADIQDTNNWETLTFMAYDVLTTVFTAVDALSDPAWWFNKKVPAKLTYDPLTKGTETLYRRTVDPGLIDNVIGVPANLVHIGDPGYYIGADDDGFVPTGRSPKMHTFAYIVFERYLKQHIFAVVYDTELIQQMGLPFPIWDTNFTNIIIAGKPSYAMLYVDPSLEFLDEMNLDHADELSIVAQVGKLDEVAAEPNQVLIGGGSCIGDYYVYDPLGGMIISNVSVAPPDPANGDTLVVVGGADPYVMLLPESLAPYHSKMMDWPVQIRVYTP